MNSSFDEKFFGLLGCNEMHHDRFRRGLHLMRNFLKSIFFLSYGCYSQFVEVALRHPVCVVG
jgi:hypothetical protein